MKKILTCLLGAAMLSGQPAFAHQPKSTHRIVECDVQGYVLLATSESEDGHITLIRIYNLSGPTLCIEDECYTYSEQVDISGLKRGNYQAKIITENAPVYSEYFTVK